MIAIIGYIGIRLAFAGAAAGPLIFAVHTDDLPVRLVFTSVAVLFLGLLVTVLVADVKRWLSGGPLRQPEPWPSDPAGRPPAAEWVVAVIFDGSCALLVWAGVLTVHADPGLLIGGVFATLFVLRLNAGLIGRWWRNRRGRP